MEYEQTTEGQQTETPSAEQSFDPQTFFREHLVKSEDGKLEIKADGLGPVELALLDTEKRRRGSQAATTREKIRADRAGIELDKLKEIVPNVEHGKTVVDESLKYTDPDAYIEQTLKARSHDPYTEAFDTASKFATQEAGRMTIESVIAEHNQAHPDKQVTQEMLELDLPPRLVSEFQAGNMAPSEFLDQASALLYRPTETHNQTIPVTPNLGEVGGQTTPTDDGGNDKMMANYATAIL